MKWYYRNDLGACVGPVTALEVIKRGELVAVKSTESSDWVTLWKVLADPTSSFGRQLFVEIQELSGKCERYERELTAERERRVELEMALSERPEYLPCSHPSISRTYQRQYFTEYCDRCGEVVARGED